MAKWKNVRVSQELVEQAKKEVEKGQYQSLSEFVSEAIRNRMQTLARERIPEYLERDRKSARVLLTRIKREALAISRLRKGEPRPDCFGATSDNPECPKCDFSNECWDKLIKKYWRRGRGDAWKGLITPQVNEELCDHCGECGRFCESNAISFTVMVSEELCDGCGYCVIGCPRKAIS